MKRWRIVLPALAGVLSGGLAWVLGVAAADAVLMGVLVAALVGIPRWLGYPADRDWPDEPEDGGQRGFYEVRRLGAMLLRESGAEPFGRRHTERGGRGGNSHAVFGRLIVPRLRELSERRVAAAGVSLDDAGAREILGADVVDWLNGRPSRLDTYSRVKQAELVLDRLEEINERYV